MKKRKNPLRPGTAPPPKKQATPHKPSGLLARAQKKISPPHIGTLREKTLHAQLKALFTRPGSRCEQRIDGYVVDILEPDGLIVEIQTANFIKLRTKLARLLEKNRVRLVYPVPGEKTIVYIGEQADEILSRKKSPKRGRVIDAVKELYWIEHQLSVPGFEFEVVLTREEELRRPDGKGSWWRKGVSIVDRRLVAVIGRHLFCGPADYARAFLPVSLPEKFTNKDLSKALSVSAQMAWRTTRCLEAAGVIKTVGKERRARVFERL